MATVTGKSSEKIDELLGQTLIGAALDDHGALTFTRKNGQQLNAGSLGESVISAVINSAKRLILTTKAGDSIDAGSVDLSKALDSWPVGSVYIGVTSTNPATLLGGGTWVRWAQGRVVVGVDPTNASYDATEETGGSATAAVPAHAHTMAHTHEHNHTHGLSTSNNAALGGSASRTNAQTTDGPSDATTGPSSAPNTGSAGAASVSVVQPYITAYLWKRTA